MKKYTLSLTMLALLVVALISGCSQSGSQGGGSDEKVTLTLQPKEGASYNLVQRMDQDISTSVMGMSQKLHQEMNFYFRYDVLAPVEAGSQLKITYERITFKNESGMMGVMVDYDSDNPEESGGNPMMAGAMTEAFAGLVDKSVTVIMDKQGKVVDVQGIEELYSGLGGDVPPTMNADNMKKTMQGMMAIFPDVQVGEGDTWGAETDLTGEFPLLLTTTYKVENIDSKTVYLNVDGEIKTTEGAAAPGGEGSIEMNGTQGGIMEVDRETGMVLKAELTQDISGEVEAGPMKAPMEIESKITIEPY